jgi:hypothetical protein
VWIAGGNPASTDQSINRPEHQPTRPGTTYRRAIAPDNAQACATGDEIVLTRLANAFGLLLPKSLAYGAPVVAFPRTGIIDVLAGTHCNMGAVAKDSHKATLAALHNIDQVGTGRSMQFGA